MDKYIRHLWTCHYTRQEGVSPEMNYALHVCYWLNISLAFCFMEVDRIQAKSTVLEAKELQQGYQGEVFPTVQTCFKF